MAIDIKSLTGITQDSRAVKQGYLFAAIKGVSLDGHDYIEDAIKNGATTVLAERAVAVPPDVALIIDTNVRKKLAEIAARYYAPLPSNIVAVTGTNGKSSVVSFVQQIWEALGYKAASIGTLSGGLTSPDPVTLAQNLAQLNKDGITHVALEASSHGLHQNRLSGLQFSAAGFTNLSHDHQDYHQTMEDYLDAKSRLFADWNAPAILNADSPEFKKLETIAQGDVISYGKKGEAIKLQSIAPSAAGYHVELQAYGKNYALNIPLVGEFQIYNVLCALGLSLSSANPSPEMVGRCIDALKTIKPVRGRLQPVAGHPQGAQVFIDYAHTPDALQTVLKALRPHTKGQLFCVFGCGGDRDKAKRPIMGRIASDHADIIIITDDNPRSEKPVDIRKAILAGIPQIRHNDTVFEIGDRAAAIDHSIKKLKKGDVLVIAGKGHESGQILANKIIPFDDVEQASRVIESLK